MSIFTEEIRDADRLKIRKVPRRDFMRSLPFPRQGPADAGGTEFQFNALGMPGFLTTQAALKAMILRSPESCQIHEVLTAACV